MTDRSRCRCRPVLAAALAFVAGGLAVAQDPFDRLLADLRSPHSGRRAAAVRALTTSGYPDAAAVIAPLVGDTADRVQLEAIDGLLTLVLAPPPAETQAAPFEVVNGSIAPSVFAAGPLTVLPRQLPPDLPETLVRATGDDDPRVRAAAAWALGVLASPAVGPLSADAEQALVRGLVEGLRSADPVTRAAVAQAGGVVFGTPRPSAPAELGDALIAAMNDRDERVRLSATQALGWLRERRALHALTERLTFLRRGDEAAAALHAIARIADASSASLLESHLDDGRVPFRVMAVEGLGRLRDRSAIPVLTDAIARERDESVMLAGAFAFYRLGEPGNLDRLASSLTEAGLRRQARAYLTELGAEAAPGLHAWLRHPNPALRQAVAEVLGLSGHAASVTVVAPVARDPDPAVGEAARQAVLRLQALPHGAWLR